MQKDNDITVVKGTTPAGIAIWPKLLEPDTKFNECGTYSLKLKLSEEEAVPLIEKITDIANEAYAKAEAEATPKNKNKLKTATPSYEEEYAEDGTPTGHILFNFKMTASGVNKKTGKPWTRKPALFDAKGASIVNPSFEIWSGSVVKVAYELMPYNSPSFGCGCSQKFSAVQILKLSEGNAKSADSFGFGVEEDGFDAAERTQVATGIVATVDEGDAAEGDF